MLRAAAPMDTNSILGSWGAAYRSRVYVISENCPKFMGIHSLPRSGPMKGPTRVVMNTVRGEAAVHCTPCRSRVSSLGASEPVISSQESPPSVERKTPATSRAAYISSGKLGSAVKPITRVGKAMLTSLEPRGNSSLVQESPPLTLR